MREDARATNDLRGQHSISDAELCNYIAEMCLELRKLAPVTQFRDLNYLLSLAGAEAEHVAKQLQSGVERR